MRLLQMGFGSLALSLAGGLLVAMPATGSYGGSFAVDVDVDGDGRPDEVMLSTDESGERTQVSITTAAKESATVSMPWRGASDMSPGKRLEGVAPVVSRSGSDVVVRLSAGRCTRYRIWNYSAGKLTAVPKPQGGLTWRVCGLGADQKGQGFRSVISQGTPKVLMYRGERKGDAANLTKVKFRWQDNQWTRAGGKVVKQVRPESVLDRWRLGFSWRTS